MKTTSSLKHGILSLILSLSLLLPILSSIPVSAVSDVPPIGSTVSVAGSDSSKQQKNSKTGRPYQLYVDEFDNGKAHHIYNRHYSSGSYNQDIILYCIELGVSDSDSYTAERPTESAHWTNLPLIAREGILMALGFGYPASPLDKLGGVKEGDAIAATQTLVWEFEKGLRTGFNDEPEDGRLFDGRDARYPEDYGINDTPAETAYKAILGLAREYLANAKDLGYTDSEIVDELEDNENFILLTRSGRQSLLSYSKPNEPLTPPRQEYGNIEVYKKDVNGKSLIGAEFTIYDSTGTEQERITTNSGGYAKSKDLLFGTYTIVETRFPEGYTGYDRTSWTVTLDKNTLGGTITINAINQTQMGSWTPSITKQLVGTKLKEEQFCFVLKEGDIILQTVSNRADGTVPFAPIRYTADDIGTHVYTIREIDAGSSGIEYDAHTVTATVTVTAGSGSLLNVSAVYSGSTTFANRYSASGSFIPSVTKTLIGAELVEGQFSFELKEGNTILQTKTNAASGAVVFDAIHYTLADVGTHVYTIAEVKGNLPGVEYDGHIVTYTVAVSDAGDGTLKVESTVTGSTTFTNTYSASGSFTPSVTKTLTGAELKEGQFSFTLSENGKVLQTKSNAASGAVAFDAIRYTLADVGTHVYTVAEIEGDLPGVAYDGHVVTYTVTVSDAGDGTLKIESTVTGSTTFTNRYSASGSFTPNVTKTLAGAELKEGQFSFTLSENGKVLQTKSNAASGAIAFDAIRYTLADVGTHVYTIAEVKGNLPGVAYDGHVVTYTVTVSDAGDGTLKIESTVTGSTTFANRYSASGSFTPSVTKTLIGAELVEGQFSFELKEDDTVLQTKTNSASGAVAFDAIRYTLADVGEHVYTIAEVKGDDPAFTYDSHTVTLTVVVSDNGDGTLTAVGSYSDGDTTFVNRYNVTSVTVNKVWIDSDNQDGLRTDVLLTLTGSDGSIYTGTIKLGETSFTWSDLPVYSGGELIVYTLTEAEIDGYTAEIVKSEDGYGFTVTNTHEPLPPQTGDNILLLGALTMVSLFGGLICLRRRREKD